VLVFALGCSARYLVNLVVAKASPPSLHDLARLNDSTVELQGALEGMMASGRMDALDVDVVGAREHPPQRLRHVRNQRWRVGGCGVGSGVCFTLPQRRLGCVSAGFPLRHPPPAPSHLPRAGSRP
jgi:hypothetical protein